jgi:hypothetical protein
LTIDIENLILKQWQKEEKKQKKGKFIPVKFVHEDEGPEKEEDLRKPNFKKLKSRQKR